MPEPGKAMYEVSGAVDAIPLSMRLNLMKKICGLAAFKPLIEAGAKIEYDYLKQDGSEIGTVVVTRKACGY